MPVCLQRVEPHLEVLWSRTVQQVADVFVSLARHDAKHAGAKLLGVEMSKSSASLRSKFGKFWKFETTKNQPWFLDVFGIPVPSLLQIFPLPNPYLWINYHGITGKMVEIGVTIPI